jgi:hypothetical protein
VKITAGTLTLASGAQIYARGSGGGRGGGSGGTIVLAVTNFANSGGVISSAGSTAAYNGGNGRFRLSYASCTASHCPHSLGGTSSAQYVPQFSTSSNCSLSAGTYTCVGDSASP